MSADRTNDAQDPGNGLGNGLGARMRRQRQRCSMTLQQLSAASGVSVGYLSQVERDRATPTLGTLSQIAEALGQTADYFIRTPAVAESFTRGTSRPRFSVSGSSVEYEQIGVNLPGHEMTSFVLNVPPGYESELIQHVGEEIIYILEGEIVQRVGGREYTMTTGDSLHYLGEKPHGWANASDKPARILWVGRMQYQKSGELSPTDTEHGVQVSELVPMRP